jgi:hypothetical protein
MEPTLVEKAELAREFFGSAFLPNGKPATWDALTEQEAGALLADWQRAATAKEEAWRQKVNKAVRDAVPQKPGTDVDHSAAIAVVVRNSVVKEVNAVLKKQTEHLTAQLRTAKEWVDTGHKEINRLRRDCEHYAAKVSVLEEQVRELRQRIDETYKVISRSGGMSLALNQHVGELFSRMNALETGQPNPLTGKLNENPRFPR